MDLLLTLLTDSCMSRMGVYLIQSSHLKSQKISFTVHVSRQDSRKSHKSKALLRRLRVQYKKDTLDAPPSIYDHNNGQIEAPLRSFI